MFPFFYTSSFFCITSENFLACMQIQKRIKKKSLCSTFIQFSGAVLFFFNETPYSSFNISYFYVSHFISSVHLFCINIYRSKIVILNVNNRTLCSCFLFLNIFVDAYLNYIFHSEFIPWCNNLKLKWKECSFKKHL